MVSFNKHFIEVTKTKYLFISCYSVTTEIHAIWQTPEAYVWSLGEQIEQQGLNIKDFMSTD